MSATQPAPIDEVGHFERLCSLLESIDEAHASESGSLVFGNDQGLILVQSGRVCWASSPAVATRLSHRLRNESSVDQRQLVAVFRDCRESGRPFGETLVERGVVTFDILRAALLEHTAETLLHLAGHSTPRWVPSRVDRYDRSLTFTSGELLTQSADVWWGPLAVEARNELNAALAGRGATGFAFLRAAGPDGAIIPVAIAGARDLSAAETLAAGRAAVDVMRSCEAVGGHLAAGTRDDGHTFIVWLDRGAYYVVTASERSEIAFIVARVSRRSFD